MASPLRRFVSFADGALSPGSTDDFSLTESLASPLLHRSAHNPRPPPAKGKNALTKFPQPPQPKEDISKPPETQYLQNRKTSRSQRSFTLRSDRTFPLDATPTPGSSIIVGQAEIIRRKAKESEKLSSFAEPSEKPMLRCRTVRLPPDEKLGPSVRSVPHIDDTWVLKPQAQHQAEHRLTREERPIVFGRGSENTAINFPVKIEDVPNYSNGPQSSTLLNDEKWRLSVGLDLPLHGKVDSEKDIHKQHNLSLKGPMPSAIRKVNIEQIKDILNVELYERIQTEKERKEVLTKIKEQNKILVENGLPIPAASTAIVNKHNRNKIARDEKIKEIKKELRNEMKGHRWKGELSSFQSNVERLPSDKSNDEDDSLSSFMLNDVSDLKGKDHEKGQFGTLRSDFSRADLSKSSATFVSATGRVPLFGDAGGSLTISRSLPISEKWDPHSSMEMTKLHLNDSNAIIESAHRTAKLKQAKIDAEDTKSKKSKASENKSKQPDSIDGLASLLSALSFDDEEDMDIDEMVALRAERRSAIHARVVAEEASKMPTVLADWLIRFKVESLKSSLASEFGIITMNDIIEADDQKMDAMLYAIPKAMRDRFYTMVQEIKHKDDLSFALSEATGSASFGVEARRSSVRPSLKTLCKRISQSRNFEQIKLTKKLSDISGVSSSIKSAGSSSIISSENDDKYDNGERDDEGGIDSDSSDDGLELLYGTTNMVSTHEFLKKSSSIIDDNDNNVTDSGNYMDDNDGNSMNSNVSRSSIVSPLTAASLNKLKRRTSSMSNVLKTQQSGGDGDVRRSSTYMMQQQQQQQQSSLLPPVRVDTLGRKGPSSVPILKILQNNIPPTSLNKNNNNSSSSSNNGNGNTISKRSSTILSRSGSTVNDNMMNSIRNGKTQATDTTETGSVGSLSSVQERNQKQRGGNSIQYKGGSMKNRIGVEGDQLGSIKSTSITSVLKREIIEERKSRLLYHSTPLTLSHMNESMRDSKNNYLKKGLGTTSSSDQNTPQMNKSQRQSYLKSSTSFNDEYNNVNEIMMYPSELVSEVPSSLSSNGGAVAAFRAGNRLEDPPKDQDMIANLDYDYDNLKSVQVKELFRESAPFTAQPRPPLFVAQTGNDFNFGATMSMQPVALA